MQKGAVCTETCCHPISNSIHFLKALNQGRNLFLISYGKQCKNVGIECFLKNIPYKMTRGTIFFLFLALISYNGDSTKSLNIQKFYQKKTKKEYHLGLTFLAHFLEFQLISTIFFIITIPESSISVFIAQAQPQAIKSLMRNAMLFRK